MLKKFLLIIFCIIIPFIYADYIPVEQAFQLSVTQVYNDKIDVHFKIKPGYDIYQDKIKITSALNNKVVVGSPVFPTAITKQNDIVGIYQVYEDSADILLPIINYADKNLILNISYQGCKGLDYCYPEITETKSLVLKQPLKQQTTTSTEQVENSNKQLQPSNTNSKPTSFIQKLSQLTNSTNGEGTISFFTNNIWLIILGFFCVGLLLAFTPCVFPMLPILFTIIAGQNATLKRSLSLSTSYVLGMASAYAFAGFVVAKFGNSVQLLLQNNIVNYILAIMFFIFSLSLFGLFELKLPRVFQDKLFKRQVNSGSIFSIYITGVISSLILSPCITAPLAGALLYIATTGNIILGVTALFAMGVGSGLPLLIFTVFGNKILPRNGIWMLIIKDLLAFMMIAMSVYVLTRNESNSVMLVFLGVVIFLSGIYFIFTNRYNSLKPNWLFMLFNVILISVSVALIQHEIDNSLYAKKQLDCLVNYGKVNRITNITELDQQLILAKAQHKPIMLDFGADWCLACKELEAITFKDKNVINLLQKFYIIKVDLTVSNAQTKALSIKYNVFAPPSLVFINSKGRVLTDKNITGYITADKLIPILTNIENQ